ncbi:hypothetical protein [Neisseria meningitidis]|uniref:hypothetical protein n=1 Tax=Neisseria meningitidis TaxID=487 RepID=UPI00081C1EB2|nr:hypothetical protein [Neisseria meningitidis]AOA48386.1 hypothetical protein A6L67_11515 [Neisseria meningitidis]
MMVDLPFLMGFFAVLSLIYFFNRGKLMKFKRMAAAFVMSAFFISYANAENDQTYISEVGSGVRFVSRGSKVFDYLNGKPIGEGSLW